MVCLGRTDGEFNFFAVVGVNSVGQSILMNYNFSTLRVHKFNLNEDNRRRAADAAFRTQP